MNQYFNLQVPVVQACLVMECFSLGSSNKMLEKISTGRCNNSPHDSTTQLSQNNVTKQETFWTHDLEELDTKSILIIATLIDAA